MDDLVERDDLYYKELTDIPFTGEITGIEQGKIKNGKKEGPWVGYYKNGQLDYKGTYKNGKWDGPWVSYYDNGQLWLKGTYKDGKWDGPWVYYYKDGQLDYKGTYKDGKLDGPWETYYYNGQLSEKGNYKDDEKEGLWVSYYKNGQLDYKGTYKDGKSDGPGVSYYEDGQLDEGRDGWIDQEWFDRGGAGLRYVEPQERCVCCRLHRKSGVQPDELRCDDCKKNNFFCNHCDGLFRYEEGFSRRLVVETSIGTLWIEVRKEVGYFDFSSIVPRGSEERLFPLESSELIPHRNTGQLIRIRDREWLNYESELGPEDLKTVIDRKINRSEIPCFSSEEKNISHEYFIFGPEMNFLAPPYRPIDDGLYGSNWRKNEIYPKDETEEQMCIISSIKRGDILKTSSGIWNLESWEREEEKRRDTQMSIGDPAYWGFLGTTPWFIMSKELSAISNPDHALLTQTLSRLGLHWQNPVMGHVIDGLQVLDSFTSASCEVETRRQREYHGDEWYYDPRLEISVEHYFLQPKGLFVKNVYFVQCQEDDPCGDDTKCWFFFSWKSGSPKGRSWLFDQTIHPEERTFGDLCRANDLPIRSIESLRGTGSIKKLPTANLDLFTTVTSGVDIPGRGKNTQTSKTGNVAHVRTELESWKSMLDDGLIDEDDYEKRKDSLLGKMK